MGLENVGKSVGNGGVPSIILEPLLLVCKQ